MTSLPKTRTRIQVQRVWPMLDCGRYPVKRTLGDEVDVWADVFSDGHDVLRAVVRYRPPGARRWVEAPMEPIGNDRWHGDLPGRGARPLAVHDHGLDRPLGLLALGDRPQARGRAEGPLQRAAGGRCAARASRR